MGRSVRQVGGRADGRIDKAVAVLGQEGAGAKRVLGQEGVGGEEGVAGGEEVGAVSVGCLYTVIQ